MHPNLTEIHSTIFRERTVNSLPVLLPSSCLPSLGRDAFQHRLLVANSDMGCLHDVISASHCIFKRHAVVTLTRTLFVPLTCKHVRPAVAILVKRRRNGPRAEEGVAVGRSHAAVTVRPTGRELVGVLGRTVCVVFVAAEGGNQGPQGRDACEDDLLLVNL